MLVFVEIIFQGLFFFFFFIDTLVFFNFPLLCATNETLEIFLSFQTCWQRWKTLGC